MQKNLIAITSVNISKIWRAVKFLSVVFILTVVTLNQTSADTMAEGAAACLSRAKKYEIEANKYANDVRDPRKLFELAMKNYLCAANAGDAFASWRVVNLSGSGQVEALPKEIEDKFLFQAAEAGLAEAQVALGYSYCDNIGTALACKNPIEAEKWFLKAAMTGNPAGVFLLGMLYEREVVDGESIKRMQQALGCYRLSFKLSQAAIKEKQNKTINQLKFGIKRSELGIERLLKQLGGNDAGAPCF